MDYGIQLLNAEDSELSSTSSTAIHSSASLSSQTLQPQNDKSKSSNKQVLLLKKCKSSLLTQEAVVEREKQKEESKRLKKEQRNRGESFATGFDGDFGNDDEDDSFYNSEEDDAAFVLQYSTLNGRRMKKDQVIEDFAIKSVLGDNPVLRLFPQKSNTRLFELSKRVMTPKVVRVLTIFLLSLIFVLPAIWNIFVAFFSYDSIVRNSKSQEPLVDTLQPSQNEMIPTFLMTNINASANSTANNVTVAKNNLGLLISEFSNVNVSTIFDLTWSSMQFCLNVLVWSNSSRNSSDDSSATIFDSKYYYYSPAMRSNPDALPLSNQTTKLAIPICFKNFSSLPTSASSQIKNYLASSSPRIQNAKIYKRDPSSNLTTSSSSSSSSIYKTSALELSWNPYVFAVFCNFTFCILAIVTYHRLEYRRRVAAYMLSYGAILVNRWNWKRIVATLLFCIVLFFACFSTFSVVFAWRYWEAVMANNNNNDIPTTTSGSSANEIPKIVFEVDFTPSVDRREIILINVSAVSISNNNNNKANLSSSLYENVSFIIGDDFFLRQIPEISQMISALEILQNQTDSSLIGVSSASSFSSSSSSSTTTMSSISNFLNKLTSSSNSDNDGNQQQQQQQFSASFMFFVTSLFGALLPYYCILTMIWRRLTTPTIYDQLYFTNRNSQSTRSIFFTLSMMRYMTSSEKAKFQCDIDVAMRAIRLVSFTTARINDGKEEQEREDEMQTKKKVGASSSASFSGFSTPFEASYELLGPGFIFSEFFAAGWITGWSTPWKARRTSKARPHELFFGTSWGQNEEEANAVLSVLFEHGCLHFLNAQLEDDVHWNKPVLSTEEEEVQRNNNVPMLSVELLQQHDQRQEATRMVVVPSAEPSTSSISSNHNDARNQNGFQHTYFTPANQIQQRTKSNRDDGDDDNVDNYFQNSSSFVEADDDSQHEINL